ncbi:MAG TPA: glycosyltransferase family 2 protein [Gammaproteobacteria bacterium]|nr:glycosyltransferase family 2 protein [Gammaproteobacteria bacterium]
MSANKASVPHRRLGIIILNYNGAGLTRRCVESVLEHTPSALDYSILVVDNGSRPEDRDALAPLGDDPRVQVVYSRNNLGFGGGHMFGLQFVRADYYLFLNSDCRFLGDAAGALVAFMDGHPSAGLASALSFDTGGQFQCTYHPAPNLAELLLGRAAMRRFQPARFPDRRRAPEHPIQTEVVTGATLFVRGQAFDELGGFDPFFFLYCEEEDLALRMREAGWEVWVVPEARIEHAGRGSTPRGMAYRREFFISFLYYLRKHHGFAGALAIRWFYVLKMLRRARRDREALSLALFILRGAPAGESLRYSPGRQKAD